MPGNVTDFSTLRFAINGEAHLNGAVARRPTNNEFPITRPNVAQMFPRFGEFNCHIPNSDI